MVKIHTDKNVVDLLTKAFDATGKAKTINGDAQSQALVDGKKVVINESTIRRDLQLEDVEGVDFLPNVAIFEQLSLMEVGKYFLGRVTPLFSTMMVQAQEEMGEGSKHPTDPHYTPTIIQPSTSQPQKKQKSRKPRRKDTKVPQFNVPTSILDEGVNVKMYDSLERVATSATSLDADLGGGPKCQEAIGDVVTQTRSKRVSKVSNDPLFIEVNTSQSERSKKQKVKDDKESEELRKCLETIPDDGDEVTIDATPLSSKSPIIVDYKIYQERKKSYFQIFRADGNSQIYLTFSQMLENFDREDLEVHCRLVKDRFKKLLVKPMLYALSNDMEEFSAWETSTGLMATRKAKTINGEAQSQALVDGKKVVINESTIRRDFQQEDVEGVDFLPNVAIFEQLSLMGYEKLLGKLTF
nr:hypothetical protein [Tanacetum cinerariifolium]